MENLFKNIFSDNSLTIVKFMICIGISFVLGLVYYFTYSYKEKSSKSFSLSIIMLPAIISVVIIMVNGSLGVGVAIAGAFSLVRFRSAQCSAKELSLIFMTMCTGLIIGVGYIGYGVLFTIIMSILLIITNIFISKFDKNINKTLKITIPEDLNYEDIFNDILKEYTSSYELLHMKTSNMGSLYKLTYDIKMKKEKKEKDLIDELRIRNGNLEISINKKEEEFAI